MRILHTWNLNIPGKINYTRDQLVVEGVLENEKFILLLITGHQDQEENLVLDHTEIKLLN